MLYAQTPLYNKFVVFCQKDANCIKCGKVKKSLANPVRFIVQFNCHTEYAGTKQQKGWRKTMDYIFKTVFEHIEVYDVNGSFLFSADTMKEALAELRLTNAA